MVNRFRLALVLALFLGLIWVVGKVVQTASAQGAQNGTDTPAEYSNALQQATTFLSQKIGKPISKLDNFTYEQATFPDAGLGCSQPGTTYAPAPVSGYKFLITLDGISYELHTSLDGSKVALCSGTSIKQQAGLVTYRSPLFSIPYPDQWTSVDRDSDIFFGLGPRPVCAQPGMTVTALGSVGMDKTPDNLLDEYARATPGTQPGSDRISIGNTGRSATYVTPCTDGTPRMMRVTAFVAYGRGYRVLQFAPQSAFNQWADTYLKILQQFAPGSAPSSGNSGLAVQQPDKSPLALLAHVFAGNVYTGILAGLPGIPITTDAVGNRMYQNIAVSPAGDQLVFIDPASAGLYAAPTTGATPPRKLAEKLAAGYPAAWSPDGHEVAYLTDEGAKDGDRSIYSVMAVRADDQTTRKMGDTQSLRAGCTDKTADPSELAYWSETGPGGNPLLLNWTKNGTIYYSLGCDGIGIGQINGDGSNSAVVHPSLRRAHVSPDGSELLGLTGQPPTMIRFKPGDRSAVTIATSGAPDQVAWSTGDAVYYSTLAAKNTIALNDQSQRDRGNQVFGTWPFQSTVYGVTLHKIDLATNQDVVLSEATGRAIGRIAPSPDGSGVLYTLIESDANLAEAFQNNASSGDLLRQMPVALLYWITLPDGQPQLLAYTADPTWGGVGSASAPTPTSGPKQTPGALKPSATIQPTISPTVKATLPALPPATNTRQPEPTSAK